MRIALIVLGVLLVCTPSPAEKKIEVWMGHLDPMRLVDDGAQWDFVKNHVDVLCLFADKVNTDCPPDKLAKLVKILNEHKIKIAIECGGTLEYVPLDDDNGRVSAQMELGKLQKLFDAGGVPAYFNLDGPIRRLLHPGLAGSVGFLRTEDAVDQLINSMRETRKRLPHVQFFDITNFPNWGWKGGPSYWGRGPRKQFYGDYWDVLRILISRTKKAGIPLQGITVDNPYDFATGTAPGSILPNVRQIDWMGRVLELERYVRGQGLEFNLFFNSGTGSQSEKLLYKDTLAFIDAYRARGGSPDRYILESWYAHPKRIVPESEPYTMTYLVKAAIRKIRPGL